jgi:NADH-quinone oxidoreductase subunit N
LFSLAGIPLTAGFFAKFYVLTAGVGSALWWLVIILVVSSAIGLYYYLRIIVIMYQQPLPQEERPMIAASLPFVAGLVLALLTFMLVWLGLYPAPLLDMIRTVFGTLV